MDRSKLLIILFLAFSWTIFTACPTVDEETAEEIYAMSRYADAYELHYKKKALYADKYLYAGLTNQREYIDSSKTFFLNKADCAALLQRVEEQGLGVLGIETWKNGEFHSVQVYEEHSNADPYDTSWYYDAFRYVKGDPELIYLCTFEVPLEKLVEFEGDSSLMEEGEAVYK